MISRSIVPGKSLNIAVTGHRLAHPGLVGRVSAVEETLRRLFQAVCETGVEPSKVTLRALLADGVDQIAARLAIACGWRVEATLPFGLILTCAIGASSDNDDADTRRALLKAADDTAKTPPPSQTAAIAAFMSAAAHAHVHALPERDEHYSALWIAASNGPDDRRRFIEEASHRYALAAGNALDQSDLLVAVWDGASSSAIGGTGHTMQAAAAASIPVIWIEPSTPQYARLIEANARSAPMSIESAVAEALQVL